MEEYAEKSGKNPWQCVFNLFNQDRQTIFVVEDGVPISFIHGYLNNDGELFIHYAYVDHPDVDSPKWFNTMCTMMADKYDYPVTNVVMETKETDRLWKRYGFIPTRIVYGKKLTI